jgi:ligand-binding sensor domain-containing protein
MDVEPIHLNGTWRHYGIAEGLPDLKLEHIETDAAGYLWISTDASGVCRFDGDTFETFTTRDGLPSNGVQALLYDSQGRLWLGTRGGVCYYDGDTFHRFAPGDGVSDRHITFISEDRDGRIFVGGYGAMGYYDGTCFYDLDADYRRQYGEGPRQEGPLRVRSPLESNLYIECSGISQDNAGHIWFAFMTGREDFGLLRWDGAVFQRYGQAEGLVARGRNAVGVDAQGLLWVGSGHEILCFDGERFQRPAAVEAKSQIRKIYRDRLDRVWFCTTGDGVYCYDGTFHHFTPQLGLAYPVVNSVFEDREGLIWFATWGNGLCSYDQHSVRLVDLDLFQQGVSDVVEDTKRRLWLQMAELGESKSEGSTFILL